MFRRRKQQVTYRFLILLFISLCASNSLAQVVVDKVNWTVCLASNTCHIQSKDNLSVSKNKLIVPQPANNLNFQILLPEENVDSLFKSEEIPISPQTDDKPHLQIIPLEEHSNDSLKTNEAPKTPLPGDNPHLQIILPKKYNNWEIFQLEKLDSGSDGGDTVLNGGDDIGSELSVIFSDLVSRASRLKEECFEKFGFTFEEFEAKIKELKYVIINPDDKIVYIYIDDNNHVTNQILINGERKPGANVPSQNLIFFDRALWSNQLESKHLLVIHEIFGLLEIENTKQYSLSAEFLVTLQMGRCQMTKDNWTRPDALFEPGCKSRNEINFSKYDLTQSQYDHPGHLLSFYSKKDKCLFFWDNKNESRKQSYDFTVHFEFIDYTTHNGIAYFRKDDFTFVSINYLDLATKDPIEVMTFEKAHRKQVSRLFKHPTENLLFYESEGQLIFIGESLEPIDTLQKITQKPLKQILPILNRTVTTDGGQFPQSNHYFNAYLIYEDGAVEYLYYFEDHNRNVDQFVIQQIKFIEQRFLKFPFMLSNFATVVNNDGVSLPLFEYGAEKIHTGVTLGLYSGFSHNRMSTAYLRLSQLTSYDYTDILTEIVNEHGFEALDWYTRVEYYIHDRAENAHFKQSTTSISGNIDKVYFDSRLDKFIFLISSPNLNDHNNVSIKTYEEKNLDDGTFSYKRVACRFHNSLCQER